MIRPVAEKTYNAVMLDNSLALSPACMIDYGLDKGDFEEKFGALQKAARAGATKEEFDFALGSGIKLTELVRKYGANVVFEKTSWDILKELEEE